MQKIHNLEDYYLNLLELLFAKRELSALLELNTVCEFEGLNILGKFWDWIELLKLGGVTVLLNIFCDDDTLDILLFENMFVLFTENGFNTIDVVPELFVLVGIWPELNVDPIDELFNIDLLADEVGVLNIEFDCILGNGEIWGFFEIGVLSVLFRGVLFLEFIENSEVVDDETVGVPSIDVKLILVFGIGENRLVVPPNENFDGVDKNDNFFSVESLPVLLIVDDLLADDNGDIPKLAPIENKLVEDTGSGVLKEFVFGTGAVEVEIENIALLGEDFEVCSENKFDGCSDVENRLVLVVDCCENKLEDGGIEKRLVLVDNCENKLEDGGIEDGLTFFVDFGEPAFDDDGIGNRLALVFGCAEIKFEGDGVDNWLALVDGDEKKLEDGGSENRLVLVVDNGENKLEDEGIEDELVLDVDCGENKLDDRGIENRLLLFDCDESTFDDNGVDNRLALVVDKEESIFDDGGIENENKGLSSRTFVSESTTFDKMLESFFLSDFELSWFSDKSLSVLTVSFFFSIISSTFLLDSIALFKLEIVFNICDVC